MATFSAGTLEVRIAGRTVSSREGFASKPGSFLKRVVQSLTAGDAPLGGKITSTGSSDVATIPLSTGVAAQTTGTPTLEDLDGKDNDGISLGIGTSSLLLGVVIVAGEGNTGSVGVSGSDDVTVSACVLEAGGVLVVCQPNANAVGADTLSFTFDTIGDEVEVYGIYDKAV